MKTDSILFGLIVGLLLPVVGYFSLQLIYDLLEARGLGTDLGFTENFRTRTTALLAICLNLIPFLLFNRRWQIQPMRGVIFPTVIYAVAWLLTYGTNILDNSL